MIKKKYKIFYMIILCDCDFDENIIIRLNQINSPRRIRKKLKLFA